VRLSRVKKLDFEPIKSGATPSIVYATGITAAQNDQNRNGFRSRT